MGDGFHTLLGMIADDKGHRVVVRPENVISGNDIDYRCYVALCGAEDDRDSDLIVGSLRFWFVQNYFSLIGDQVNDQKLRQTCAELIDAESAKRAGRIKELFPHITIDIQPLREIKKGAKDAYLPSVR